MSTDELHIIAAREYERQLLDKERALQQREADINERFVKLERAEAETSRRFRTIDLDKEPETAMSDIELLRLELDNLKREIRRNRTPAVDHSRHLPSPQIKLKEIVDSIPCFNGHNISVLQFSRACKRAQEMLPHPVSPETEANLVRLIRMKLQGHAYIVVEDEPISTIEKLKDILKTAFMPSRTVNYYRGALANLHKRPDEHVLDYISRAKDLKQAILEEESKIHGDYLNEIERTRIDQDALECFTSGLPPEYRLPLKMEGCRTLTEAFNVLININQQLERDVERIRNQARNRIPATNVAVAKRVPCNICGKSGHTDDTCWQNPKNRPETKPAAPRGTQQSTAGQTSGRIDRTNIICNYCKQPGHMKFDCEKRRINNERRQQEQMQGNDRRGPTPSDASQTAQKKERLFTSNIEAQPSTSTQQ